MYLQNHPQYQEIIVSDNLKLIIPNPKYAEVSLSWVSDPDVIKFMGGDFTDVSLEGEKKRLNQILEDQDAYHWMIEVDGDVVGNINLDRIEDTSEEFGTKAAKLNYLLGNKKYWGQGITSQAIKALIEWAWSADFETLKARVIPQNKASLAIMHKFGFKEYGTDKYEGTPLGEETWNILFKFKKS